VSGLTRRGVAGLLGLGLAACAFLLLRPTDEKRVLGTLKELGAAVSSLPGDVEGTRRKRVAWSLLRLTTDDVALLAPEISKVEGRAAILELLELAEGLRLEVVVEQADIRAKSKRAEATLLVSILVSVPSEERRQRRTVNAELVRDDGGFRVKRLIFSGISREQPEARP
jgi:hypothetical protein